MLYSYYIILAIYRYIPECNFIRVDSTANFSFEQLVVSIIMTLYHAITDAFTVSTQSIMQCKQLNCL